MKRIKRIISILWSDLWDNDNFVFGLFICVFICALWVLGCLGALIGAPTDNSFSLYSPMQIGIGFVYFVVLAICFAGCLWFYEQCEKIVKYFINVIKLSKEDV